MIFLEHLLKGLLPKGIPVRSIFSVSRAPKFYSSANNGIKIIYVTPEGEEIECYGRPGQDLMHLAHDNDVDLEGACDGACACSTCHLIFEKKYYDMLPEPSEDENDMLDLAFGLTETSRLGCQVKINRKLDGMKVRLPAATRNIAVDGFKPKPH